MSVYGDEAGGRNRLYTDPPKLPQEFVRSLNRILDENESRLLMESLDSPPPVSIRYNQYKYERIKERHGGNPVPWCGAGIYLDRRPSFTLDPLFHTGAYYPQEASSMFIGHVYRSVAGEGKGLRILDLCAAPGGKSTLLAALAGEHNIVVANETIRSRAFILAGNVSKWGSGNVVVTNNDPSHFSSLREYFDIVLTDLPCSGEGMFRKNPSSRNEWSASNVGLCAARQRRITGDILDSLKPGGVLIYSTCTFNTVENEENIEWIASNYECEPVSLEVPSRWGLAESFVEGRGRSEGSGNFSVFRFYPHRVGGEGFFVSVLRKAGGKTNSGAVPARRRSLLTECTGKESQLLGRWVDRPQAMTFARAGDNLYGYFADAYPVVKQISETLSVIHSGVPMGKIFSGELRPDHSLAMFHDINRECVPAYTADREEALSYLRKGEAGAGQLKEGVNLIFYKGLPLGWVKRIGNRVNNMLPKELRITSL